MCVYVCILLKMIDNDLIVDFLSVWFTNEKSQMKGEGYV